MDTIEITQPKENIFKIYDYVNNNFTYIWDKLVKTYDFIKIKKEEDEENDIFDINIDDSFSNIYYDERYIREQRNYRKYLKSYNFDETTKIIYENDECLLLITNLKTNIFNKIYAVEDQYYKNRFFVGFDIENGYTNSSITGIIIYFNNDNKHTITHVLRRELFNYDFRNGEYDTYLYRQSLVFTQSHRDIKKLTIGLILLDNNDFVIDSLKKQTDIDMKMYFKNRTIIDPRFIVIEGIKDSNKIFDLGSLKSVKVNNEENKEISRISFLFKYYDNNYIKNNNKNETKYLVINSYTVNKNFNSKELKVLVKNISGEMEYYGDEYPENCILCNNKTSEGHFEYKNMYMGLGNAYCSKCNIRYSKTRKTWECCKVHKNENNVCEGVINDANSFICQEEHSNKLDVKIFRETNNSSKFPYKNSVHITLYDI